MLMHVLKNIPDNTDLADAANELVDRKDSCKQTLRHYSLLELFIRYVRLS